MIPGGRTFFVGSAPLIKEWDRSRNSKEPYKNPIQWLHDKIEPEKKQHDAAKYPFVVYNLASRIVVTVADPEVVQELWTTKQKIFDKSGEFQYHFHHFFGDSFLFQKGDALWKAKRKATSHAFYKERMVEMT